MVYSDRVVNIIEDHESIVQTLSAIVFAIKNKKPMPQFIPILNDTLVTDHLCVICEELNKLNK